MAFVTGLLLIDAPASALNNAGIDQSQSDQNVTNVKFIRSGRDVYPYVSAQAYRYWLRSTLPKVAPRWVNAPVYKESSNLAYTSANPVEYWDDDIFGYMRAPQGSDINKRKADPEYAKLTSLDVEKGKEKSITRVSPFRVSTLVSIAPVTLVQHTESMTRHEGDPVLFTSQFYRATLKGLFSLDLSACGTFSYRNKTGFRNLDDVRTRLMQDVAGHEHLEEEKAYRLPYDQRVERVKALFEGMAQIEGGAKQTLHYTDVSPALVILAVTKGGNHIFHHAVGANRQGHPEIKPQALREALTIYADTLLSPVYVGWVRGYQDEERAKFETFAKEYDGTIIVSHPRTAFQSLISGFKSNPSWLD
jgi:CRISPR-associated protein Cst2